MPKTAVLINPAMEIAIALEEMAISSAADRRMATQATAAA